MKKTNATVADPVRRLRQWMGFLGCFVGIHLGFIVQSHAQSDHATVADRPAELRGTTRSPLKQSVAADGKPSLPAVRVEEGPIIDGYLDDDVWLEAPIGGPLAEYEPMSGILMTELTEFRVLYDDDRIYVGVWCYDSEPEGIKARFMERDFSLFSDDTIQVVFDTFHDLRNGYIFMVNPNGARRDELISNNTQRNINWDGIWEARCRVNPDGWTVEMAVPFKTLSFEPSATDWGFNITRGIVRKAQRGRWSGARPQIRTANVSEAGVITGLKGLKQGLGIELSPYAIGRYTDRKEPADRDRTGDAGGEVRYRITPNLSTTISYNTDFAETEVDARQINLTRFPLFFPEKRDFFLEDSGIYEVGGLHSGIASGSRGVFRTPLIPYFTRRIGLSDKGEVVPIIAAAKLAGRVGKYNMAITDAVLESHDDISAQNVIAGRFSRNVFEQSSVGVISTFGDPNSEQDNALLGPDFQYRTTKFMGNKILEANVYALGTYTEDADTELAQAYGASISYPNDLIRAQMAFMEIDDDFNPALGFVRRKGIRAYGSLWSYEPRPATIEWARQFRFTYSNQIFTELSNEIDTQQHEFTPFRVQLDSADEFYVSIRREHDSPNDDFEIIDDVVIQAGDYWWTDYVIGMELAPYRIVNGRTEASAGDFYDGTRQQVRSMIEFLPWKYLNFVFEYEYNHIDLPDDEFHTHIGSMRMIWNFTPDMTWSHFVQYDNLSDTVGLNSRFQWEYRPGSKLFFVINQGYLRENSSIRVMNSEVAAKVGATFRF